MPASSLRRLWHLTIGQLVVSTEVLPIQRRHGIGELSGIGVMQSRDIEFNCPYCQAGYKVVRVPRVGPTSDVPVLCRACEHPLASNDGGDMLKYFLIDAGQAPKRGRRVSGRRSKAED